MHNEACLEEWKDLPRKEVDPGVLVLPVSIGNMEIVNALIYLGSNFNIMPLLAVDRIEYLRIEPHTSTLYMAEKTCRTPICKVKKYVDIG